ncbi:hypothetical protein FQA39_LY19407 [Lamprigera yunnana]|nr:hypothetical protein FQA39_LY19407 [Lamprigera yunnana]
MLIGVACAMLLDALAAIADVRHPAFPGGELAPECRRRNDQSVARRCNLLATDVPALRCPDCLASAPGGVSPPAGLLLMRTRAIVSESRWEMSYIPHGIDDWRRPGSAGAGINRDQSAPGATRRRQPWAPLPGTRHLGDRNRARRIPAHASRGSHFGTGVFTGWDRLTDWIHRVRGGGGTPCTVHVWSGSKCILAWVPRRFAVAAFDPLNRHAESGFPPEAAGGVGKGLPLPPDLVRCMGYT